MNERQLEQGKRTACAPDRGIMLFKEHIAAMKSGSWRLGGDKGCVDAGQEQDQREDQ